MNDASTHLPISLEKDEVAGRQNGRGNFTVKEI